MEGPFGRLDGVNEHVDYVQRGGVRNVPVLEQAFPVLKQGLPELLVERSGVREEPFEKEKINSIQL